MIKVSEPWLQQSKNILNTLEKFATSEENDRLEIINAMLFTLNALDALDRSLQGWRRWVQNLAFMSRFTQDELQEIERGLIEKVRAFVQFDMEVTQQHEQKIPQIRFRTRRRRRQSEATTGLVV
jgi:hypothetical protein